MGQYHCRRGSRRVAALLVVAQIVATFGTPFVSGAAPSALATYDFDAGSGTTLADRSGNNHPGTLVNGPTWTAGKYNGGLSFDGVNDYVTFGDVAQADSLTAITVSAWVKFASAGGGANETHFVDKSQCAGFSGGGPWELGAALTSSHKAEFVIYPQGAKPTAYLFSGPSTTSIDDVAWHYVTGRYDGSRLSIWVDGNLENSNAIGALTMLNSSSAVELGGHCNGFSQYPFKGSMDDVRLYARALTPAEILADMSTPVGNGGSQPTDTLAPSTPTRLTASGITASQATLSWQASTDNVAVSGYRVYRSGAVVGTTSSTTFTSAGLAANTSYAFTVAAFDSAGNTSPQSAPRSITTASGGGGTDSTPPTKPTGVVASGVTSSSATLSWQASTDNVGVAGYGVFRGGALAGTSTSTTFVQTGLAANTTYVFMVAAVDAAGNVSATSTPYSVTTASALDSSAPSIPTGLASSGVTTSQVTLSWRPSTDNVGVSGYRVYRSGTLVGTTSSARFTSAGLAANTSYAFTVAAFDSAGNTSLQSAPLSVTTATGSGGGSGVYSTSFDQTENPLSEGGKWVVGKATGLDWNNPQSASGNAYASVLSGANGASRYNDSVGHLNASSLPLTANQYAQGTVYLANGYSGASHEVELLLRFSINAHDAHGYEVLWGLTGYMAVVRWNGPLGDYTPIYDPGPGSISVPKDGDVLRAEISGNTIVVKLNGNTVATVSVSGAGGTVWSSGQPGVGFWPVDNAVPENFGWTFFEAGNL